MDLLRFEDKHHGPVYVDSRALMIIARNGEDTNVGVKLGDHGVDLTLAGDPDEIAQAIERAVPGARVHRIV